MLKKFLVCLIFLFSSVPAYSEIDKYTVENAWRNIALAGNFEVVKVNYEDQTAPNAWVLFKSEKDFSVHVTTGLMKILNYEEEIAGVMGHELGHIKLGHYNKSKKRNTGLKVGGKILSWGLGRITGGIGGVGGAVAKAAGDQAISVGQGLISGGFSREQEIEADDYGTDLLVSAGYSPYGLYYAMKAFKDNGIETKPSGFNSHPPTDRRLKHIYDRAKKIDLKLKLGK